MKLITFLCCALALTFPTASSWADVFPLPSKPIRIIVGAPPGGGTDTQARLVATRLQKILGVSVIVENKPGASMMLAAIEVSRSVPDGHTILYTPDTPFTQAPHTIANVAYDPFKDFTPLSLGSRAPLVLVASTSPPVNSASELAAYARANPGKLTYASFGVGSASHLYGEMFSRRAGAQMVHVPYKGAADVVNDLIAGRVQVMFAAASGAVQFVKSGKGKVKILAVAAPSRSSLLPGVPTMSEQGISGMTTTTWLGFFGPAHMRPETVSKLNAALEKVLADPVLKDQFGLGASEAESSSPSDLAIILKSSYAEWGRIVNQLGMSK